MASDLIIKKLDESFIKIKCSSGIHQELFEQFRFFKEGAQFSPKFKKRLWDGYINLYSLREHTLPIGLLFDVIKFCKEREYSFEIFGELTTHNYVDKEELQEFVKSLNLPFELRWYQFEYIYNALRYRKSIIFSPVNSGKTLMIYVILRWLLAKDENYRFLMMVPRTQLVLQAIEDWKKYGWTTAEEDIHCIYDGAEKISLKNVYISTWQAMTKIKNKAYFRQFDCIFADEAHLFSADVTKTLLEACDNSVYKIGTSGSLDDSKMNKLQLKGLLGPSHKIIEQHQLIEEGVSSKISVKVIQLVYPKEIAKSVSGFSYQNEIDFIIDNKERVNFIVKLADKQQGNTLILFNKIKNGEMLAEKLRKSTNKQIYLIHGSTPTEERMRIAKLMEDNDDVILVASYGTTSTGTSINNINTLILWHPSKSQVRITQSAGRLLRKGKNINVTMYDIIDDFSYKSAKNTTLNHGLERIKLYIKEKFPVKIHKLEIRNNR